MILDFKDNATFDLFHGVQSRKALKFPIAIQAAARRKLDLLNAAAQLGDLRVPPGNRLKALEGQYDGFYSIRINDQYRVIFQWTGHDAKEVQILDYH